MSFVKLSKKTYYDKVYGCWLGKNAGGTLGGPLEQIWGKEEMFDVWWYPKLVEGGIPNDDLEIQLVWLQAIKDRGLQLTARDLAEYWLDCILYNYDEYGLHKTNLRKGLQPPVSGWYNNWFKDCMGSPIRSEIWACIAPGAPHIAAWYAYQDAICDHAGGESVYGEVFNAVIESSAFLIEDRVKLVEIGLSAIPENCLTSKAVRTALRAYFSGLDWREAREKVKEVAYSPVAQYSPINLGFQTIGILYGEDFGDAMCKAVNCGWDTDCTGATVGAIWGIITGRSGLPKRWIEPLGDRIVVSRGIRNVHIPADLDELTKDVCRIGEKALAYFDTQVKLCDIDDLSTAENVLKSSLEKVKNLWKREPNRLDFDLVAVRASIVYLDGPALLPSRLNRFVIMVKNKRPVPISGTIIIHTPDGWILNPSHIQRIRLSAGERAELKFSVTASVSDINTSNRGTVEISLDGRPGLTRLPLYFVGGFRWLVSEVFREPISLDAPFPPEKDAGLMEPGEGWKALSWPENALEVEPFFKGKPGVIYLRHFIYSPEARKVVLGVPNNSRMRLWLNGKVIHETQRTVPLRPNYSGDGTNYTTAVLKRGWNHIMVKLLRSDKPLEAHFTVADAEWYGGMIDLIRCKLPWE
ncbi:ADP-ribosylglycohydrolase family protein [Candidatus Bathyarchaeota archaeon]|nr:MAG: ADP-ribosylglycohydrolase family protein [Candidatus Bathyarchaeota archaeon]